MALSGRGLICWSSLPIQFPKLSYQKGKKNKNKNKCNKKSMDPLFRSLGRFLGRASGDLIAQEGTVWYGTAVEGSKCGDDDGCLGKETVWSRCLRW